MQAPCVCHFHDPSKRVGKAITQNLGASDKVAWDIYLFYPKGIEWDDSPPLPFAWAHQLGTSNWADPARYCTGNDLVEELTKAMEQLTSSSMGKDTS